MIGIGTVFSDNPRLTVRHVAGRNPQPIVLDSKLRIPLDCSLLGDRRRCVWLATVEGCAPQRRQAVEAAGAQNSLFPCHRRRPRGSREYPLAFLRKGYRLRDGGGRGESNQEPAGRKASRLPCDHHSPSVCRRRARGASADRAIDGSTLESFHHAKIGGDLVLWGEPAWSGLWTRTIGGDRSELDVARFDQFSYARKTPPRQPISFAMSAPRFPSQRIAAPHLGISEPR